MSLLMNRWFSLLIMLLIVAGFVAGCGGSAKPPSGIITAPTSTPSGAGIGTPLLVEPTPIPTAVVTPSPISRQARFDYPRQMQVNKPAKVQFSLFVAGEA